MAALQAGSRTAFFNAIAVTHEPLWPPAPFELSGLDWAADHLAHDPDGEGWYGSVLLTNDGERAPSRLVGIAALLGRPDEDGDVELAFGLMPEFRGRGYGADTIRTLSAWALSSGAKRVLVQLDAEDAHAARALAKSGFADTGLPPYPGVALWALSARVSSW